MKRNLILLCLPLLLSGCYHGVVSRSVTATGTNVTFRVTSLLSNSALKGLGVETVTKTTSSLLKLTAGSTEPNPEAITASGTALGELIGAATATTAKTVVKP